LIYHNETTKKKIYFWNIIGSSLNALASVILLSLVNHILGLENGDIFSIGFSISQLMMTIGTFQVRVYQATDVKETFKFVDYLVLRVITCAAMIIASVIFVCYEGYPFEKNLVVLSLCLFRMIDAFSDVFQGLFQLKERLDISGISVSVKIVFPTIVFGVSLLVTKDLLVSSILLMASSLLLFYIYDISVYKGFIKYNPDIRAKKSDINMRKVIRLLLLCLPLFINGYLINSIYNEPKIVIDHLTTSGYLQSGIQTYYTIIFMPSFVINLLFILLRPLLTTMAIEWNQNNVKRVIMILVKVVLFLGGSTLVLAVASWIVGIPVLSVLFGTGDGLYPYRFDLVLIMIAGGINAIASMLDNVVTILRCQQYLLFAYLISFLSSKFLSEYLIKMFLLDGAVYSYLISMVVLLIAVFLVFIISINKSKNIRKE
jgi:O-antigen/teichoic acid export membrane protein